PGTTAVEPVGGGCGGCRPCRPWEGSTAMTTNMVRLTVVLGTVALYATPGVLAETARFRQGGGGDSGTKGVDDRGGKAIPAPPKEGSNKKTEAPKKRAEAPKKPAEAPKAVDSSISVDLDNDGQQSQALIRFDDIVGTGPGQVPPGSTVTAAVLTLHAN